MSKIRLTESDLIDLIKKMINESDKEINEALGSGSTNERPDKLTTSLQDKTVQLGKNLFKLGSDEINTQSDEFIKAKDILSKIGKSGKVTLQGGASSVGQKNGYNNEALASRRAANFKKALADAGVDVSNFTIDKGIVTPNTDVPNSEAANNAQFVRFAVSTLMANSQQQLAIDNTARKIVPISKIVGPKPVVVEPENANVAEFRIVFPKDKTANDIYGLIKTALKGVVYKVTRTK
jgi:hypothetical protein